MEARYLRGGRLPRSRGDGMFSAPPRGRKRVVPEGSEQVAAGHEGLRPDRPRRGTALSQARGKHKQGRHERVVRHPSRRLRVDAVAHGSARRRQRSPLDDRRQSRVKRWRCRRATCAREEFVDLAERQRANCSRAGKRAAFLVAQRSHKTAQGKYAPQQLTAGKKKSTKRAAGKKGPRAAQKAGRREDACVAQREGRVRAHPRARGRVRDQGPAGARRKRQAGA